MNCRDANISLQLAEDGEVSREERAALDAHLGECLDCRRMAAWLEVVEETYPPAPILDDDFANDVLRCLSPGVAVANEDMSEGPVATVPVKPAGWFRSIGTLLTRGARRQSASRKGPGWSRRAAGALWAMLSRGARRQSASRKGSGWSSRLVDAMPGGFRAVGPAMAPALVAPAYATGWIRITGGNLRDRARWGR